MNIGLIQVTRTALFLDYGMWWFHECNNVLQFSFCVTVLMIFCLIIYLHLKQQKVFVQIWVCHTRWPVNLLCFPQNNSTNNKADNIDNQDEPSCAVTDKLHVSPAFSKLFGTCAHRGGGPSNPPDRWDCLGLLRPDPNSRSRAEGSFHEHVNVNSSPSHQRPAPRPISKQGPEKQTLEKHIA